MMILVCHSLADSAPAADPLDSCNVVWGSPSENAHGSMPLGNGDVGINAWVEGIYKAGKLEKLTVTPESRAADVVNMLEK